MLGCSCADNPCISVPRKIHRKSQAMANRPVNLDPIIFSIRDIEREGTKRLPEGYRDYYNGGAMDMITYAIITEQTAS